MTIRIPPNEDKLRELELLVRARHPLWSCLTAEQDRLHQLLADLGERCGLPFFVWSPITGLVRQGGDGAVTAGTASFAKCVSFLVEANYEGLFLLEDVGDALRDPENVATIKKLYRLYFGHRGTIVFAGASLEMADDLEPLISPVVLGTPTLEEYYQYVRAVLSEFATQRAVTIDLDSRGVGELLQGLSGLSFFDVRRIITRAVVDDGRLSRDDLPLVIDAKKRILERSGVLEFHPHDRGMADVAGLENLELWLRKRQRAFLDPSSAKRFGLEPPKGLLLIGVQGCGKSLTAKAIANEWKLPLVRLDPGMLFTKYLGESERNFRKAVALAESLAPVVLWIDEIEKALAQGDDDGGTSRRIFGGFLSWMSEKKANVFVVATANEIARLPPEMLRKGRFDEIFFLDLPSHRARRAILVVHLRRRGREPDDFDLDAIADATEGWSGAELEQLVVSGLYTAFAEGVDLTSDHLVRELGATRPLSITLAEPIAALRSWAADRAIRADRAIP